MSDKKQDVPRYDVMVTGPQGYKAPQAAIRSVVHVLAFRGFATPVDEAIAKDWVEVYFEPGPAAHEVFNQYTYDGPQPVFYEAVVRAGDHEASPGYGPSPLFFMVEFRGCAFKEPLGPFRKLFLDALNLRVVVHTRDHASLPPHREVSEDEKPDEKKKKERGPGIVGTEVDEW